MKKRILFIALVTAVVFCFGIGTLSAKPKPICTTTGCPPEVMYETICCSEYLPVNPNCQSPRRCEYEWVVTCWDEPCDWISQASFFIDTMFPSADESSLAVSPDYRTAPVPCP